MKKISYLILLLIIINNSKLYAENDTQWVTDLENQAYIQAKNDTELQNLVHNLRLQVKSQMQTMAVDDFNVNITQNVSVTSNANKTESVGYSSLTLSPFVYSRFAGVLQKGTLLVFVSSSMSYGTLRNIIERVDSINRLENKSLETRLILRGVVGNNISELKPTLNFIQFLLCGENSTLRIGEPLTNVNLNTAKQNCLQVGVDINPMLFGLFNVTVAPTVIYTTARYTDITDMSRLIGTDANFVNASFDYWAFVGDLDLFYILEQIEHASKK